MRAEKQEIRFTLLSLVNADVVKIEETDNVNDTLADSIQSQLNEGLQDSSHSAISINGEDTINLSNQSRKDVIITMDNLGDIDQLINSETDSLSENSTDKNHPFRRFAQKRLKRLATEEGRETFQALMRKYISIGI